MKADLNTLLQSRILRLDGGLGTMIQALQLEEWDFRGREFLKWKCPLKGCMDLLCLTAPRSVGAIHRAYLQAGADIVTTNSFSANAISLKEYGLEKYARRIAREAARIAREEADKFEGRFVAGSMGPTSKTASIAASVEDSAARDVTFAELAEAYYEQAAGLAEGGVDAFLLETVFDTLNAKAAIFALERLRRDTGCDIPLMLSVTVSQKAGRTLSGQTIEAFWTSVKHGRPLSVGINCSFGAREMLPHLERLAAVADCYISVHPNAGLPNISGGYDETPESFAAAMKSYAERGLVNIMGGCCGTTPDFIKALGPLVDSFAPRRLPDSPRETVVCGLEALRIVPEANFINIGERCNVAGSAKFARMIREGDFAGAIAVARTQVAAGGQIIDVCMDDGLIDGPAAMRTFLNMAAGEVDIARVPFMIDSSSLDTIVAGLECCQGKAIVNSISLKEGPEEFLRRAALIRSYGAAAVVMLFDEEGQATSFERKIAVARRAYDLLIESGFPAEDIIFDPNILAVATGIKEHDRYALDFIEATRWIKENLPYAKVSGGVSNLSFAFRGNNAVREAMHSAFLYHARLAGMDMGIVNPQMLRVYDDIPGELLERVEDVILCRRADACERLSEYAAQVRESAAAQVSAAEDWRAGSPKERISYAMLHGIADHIEEDCLEALKAAGAPLEVINNMMMPAMERVGALFGEGKMFLPQVVKAAGVMKRGVSALMGDVDSDGNRLSGAVESGEKGDAGDAAPGENHLAGDAAPGSGSEKASLRAAENIEPAFPTRSFSTPGEPGTAAGQQAPTPPNAAAPGTHSGQQVPTPPDAAAPGTHAGQLSSASPAAATASGTAAYLGAAGEQRPDHQQVTDNRYPYSGGSDIQQYSSNQHDSLQPKTRVVIATVKGDIHDIGKNIVSVVLSVGGCSIVDLGVMVEPGAIVEAVKANNADYVCLSGLITPSLEQMIVVLRHLKQAGITIPVIVGGATTSPMHTAVKMAPEYDGLVVHSTDASRNMQIINQLQSPIARVHIAGILAEQQRLRNLYTAAQDRRPLEDYHQRLAMAEAARGKRETAGQDDCCQRIFSFHRYDINAVEKHLDWDMFFAEWGVKDDASRRELKAEALQMLARIKREDALDLQGVIGTFPVRVEGDDIFVIASPTTTLDAVKPQPGDAGCPQAVFPTLRNQTAGEENLSVADFAAAAAEVTLFAISAGIGLKQFAERLKAEGDEYGAFMAKTLADALTEALADEVVPAKDGERHAFGYPSCPDHSLKAEAFRLLNVEQTCDLRLTDSYMIDPAESICGMVIRGARYFAVGHIGADQLSDYARRRNISEDTLKTLIPRNIL